MAKEESLDRLIQGPGVALNVARRRFPQEMFDMFIDHLHKDRKTLAICALVCRSWVPPSRYHLFGNVGGYQVRRMAGIVKLLDNAFCTIAPAIRRVHLCGYDGEIETMRQTIDSLKSHLPKFISVKEIVVDRLPPYSWQQLVLDSSSPVRFTRLKLLNINFDSFKEWAQIIQGFPFLRTLQFDLRRDISSPPPSEDSEWLSTYTVPPEWPSLRTNFRHLDVNTSGHFCVIKDPWSQLMWDWLLRSQIRLTCLVLGYKISADDDDELSTNFVAFSRYLQFIGPSLRYLELDFLNTTSIPAFFRSVDMTLNTEIRELNLTRFWLFYEDTTPHYNVSADFLTLPEILSHVPRQLSMTKISFGFIISNESLPVTLEFAQQSDLDAAWSAIDSLVTGRSFPALTNLTCYGQITHYGDTLERTGVVKYLEQKLPKCKKRGLIDVHSWDPIHALLVGAKEKCQCS